MDVGFPVFAIAVAVIAVIVIATVINWFSGKRAFGDSVKGFLKFFDPRPPKPEEKKRVQ